MRRCARLGARNFGHTQMSATAGEVIEPMREPESHGPPGSRRGAALRASPRGGVPRRGRGGPDESAPRGAHHPSGERIEAREAATRASPGSSNTRAQTPPAHEQRPGLMLQASVDALKLAYRAALDEVGLALLDGVLGESHESGTYSIDGEPFELRRLSQDSRFVLSNATKSVLVGPHVSGFPIQVEFRALHLRSQRPADVVEEGERIARHFAAGDIAERRVWRGDLCVDATGLSFGPEDEKNCVTRARGRVRFQDPERVFSSRRGPACVVTGFVVAPGNDLSVRIYDKTEELFAVHGRDSEKTRTELAAYCKAGWDGQSAVWRVEAQFRARVLRELGAGTPVEFVEKLDSLWHYVVGWPEERSGAWLRFVMRDAQRIERCSTTPRWRVYQSARFSGRTAAERVEGSSGGVSVEQMVGSVLSCLGARRQLPRIGEDECVRDTIREDFARAADMALLLPQVREKYLGRREATRCRCWSGKKRSDP